MGGFEQEPHLNSVLWRCLWWPEWVGLEVTSGERQEDQLASRREIKCSH